MLSQSAFKQNIKAVIYALVSAYFYFGLISLSILAL